MKIDYRGNTITITFEKHDTPTERRMVQNLIDFLVNVLVRIKEEK